MKRLSPNARSRARSTVIAAAFLGTACEQPPAADPTLSVDLPPSPVASASARTTSAGTTGPLVLKEQWRLEVPGAHPSAIVGDRGELVVAWEYRESLSLPGRDAIPTMGDKDVAVTRIGPGGVAQRVHVVGGALDEEAESMAISDGKIALAMMSDSTINVAGTSLAPGPMPPGGLFPPPASFVVWLGSDDAPARAHALAPGAQSIVLGAAPGGDVVVSAGYRAGDELFGDATIQRLGSDGSVRWTNRAPAMAFSTISPVQTGLAVGTRADQGLGLAMLDPQSGALGRVHHVERASRYAGDLGAIGAIAQLGDAVLAFGETGRHVVDGHSHTIEPFSLMIRGDGPAERRQLADSTARIAGAARRGSEIVFVVDVIHTGALYGGTSLPHRGVYVGVVGATGQPRFTPVYEVAYETDDWRNGERRVVTGSYLDASQMSLDGDTLVIAGHCNESATIGCLVALSLAR